MTAAAGAPERRRIGVLGVSDTAFGILLQGLYPQAVVEVIDFADSPWSRLQCLEVRRLHRHRFSLGGLGGGVADYVARLAEHCVDRGYDLVIPINDAAVELGKRARALHPLPLALPPDPVARYAHDKACLLREAAAAGLSIPASELLSSVDELESGLPRPLPAFLKPVHTALVQDDRLTKFGVRRVETWEELVSRAREVLPSVPALLQAECPGFGLGYTFLAHEGVPLVEAFHRRLHEPARCEGGSTYRTTIPPPRPELAAACRRLLERIRWSGVGMLELRYDPASGALSVMELNGRLWGSLALHVAAGWDFPRYLLDYWLDGRRLFAPSPKVPFRARNLQRDVAWLGRRLSGRDRTLGARARLLWHWCADWQHFLRGREALDFLRLRYLDVFALHLLTPVVEHLGRGRDKVLGLARGALFSVGKGGYRRRLARVVAGRRPPRLLFVCYGNINRSAFAVAYARSVAPSVEWESAGLHPVGRRRPPLLAERAARDYRIDLARHASKVLSADEARNADAILVFDGRDHQEVGRRFPFARPRVVPVGAFDSRERAGTIADPGGRTAETYRRVFAKISRSVDGLLPTLQGAATEGGGARYVIRLDDCHPRMHRANFERVRELCDAFDVRPLAGVIPECRRGELVHGEVFAGFWDEMRALGRRGWTVAQHGFTHECLTGNGGVLRLNRKSEFAGLPYEEQRDRLERGQAILRDQRLESRVFMAPWHSLDGNTLAALKSLGFESITDGHGLMPYEAGGLTWLPQQAGTPRRAPFGVWTFALHSDGMKEGHFRALESFLRENASRVVSFEEALRFRLRGAERLAGVAMGSLLRVYRRAQVARAAPA